MAIAKLTHLCKIRGSENVTTTLLIVMALMIVNISISSSSPVASHCDYFYFFLLC